MKLFFDGTIDVKFNGDYTYYMKRNTWSSDSIEKQVQSIRYKGNNLSKNELAENTRLPPFILQFYKIVFDSVKIPSPEQLLKNYFEEFFNFKDEYKVKIKDEYLENVQYGFKNIWYDISGIENRLYRTYPSLIRDFHFLFLCHEQNVFNTVSYSLNLDYFAGYDILVEHKEKKYGISIYVETKRGNKYKRKKKNRHEYNMRK